MTSSSGPKRRSAVTQPGYHKGRRAVNKGMKLPPEILAPDEVWALLDSFGTTATQLRNRAIVWMFYGVGLKAGELPLLEVTHYDRRSRHLTVPATGIRRERKEPLDTHAVEMIDAWLEARKHAGIPRFAPLFCVVNESPGRRLQRPQIAEMLSQRAQHLGLDKRVHAEGLKESGRKHRAAQSVEHQLVDYLNQPAFQARYPRAVEEWRTAQELLAIDPVRYATPIGHHCRDARTAFLAELAGRHSVKLDAAGGSVDHLRTIMRQAGSQSNSIGAFLEALVTYWGTASDLIERQEHGAKREGEELGAEDARRVVFQLLILMNEIDRALATRS